MIVSRAGRQRYLGERGLIAFIGLLSAFVPLSIDLYLPALPSMMEQYQVSAGQLNLTLILFFVFYGLATLFWGPLSDKYGRKRVLTIGLTIYILASLMCAFSGSITMLIVFRALQAIGGGAVTAVATAMIKDVFAGRRRIVVLAMVQSMMLIAPAVAPIMGAALLQYTSWQGVFMVLAGIGVGALIGTVALDETLVERYQGSVLSTVGRLRVVLANRRFTSMVLMFSLVSASSLAFVAASSFIYVIGFGVDERTFSYYFALNALGLILAPIAYIFLSRRYDVRPVITICFLIIALAGLMVVLFGGEGPLFFALALLPATFCSSLTRAPGTNLMLDQQRTDTGSAASLISCASVFMGSLGMSIMSLGWTDLVVVLGVLNVLTGSSCLVMWRAISRRTPPEEASEGPGSRA